MSINITNKQILSFFEQHPTLNPEITILKFININGVFARKYE